MCHMQNFAGNYTSLVWEKGFWAILHQRSYILQAITTFFMSAVQKLSTKVYYPSSFENGTGLLSEQPRLNYLANNQN